jgi:hypothetical protein
LAIKPKKVYFASQTAAPMFYDVVDTMVKFGYLEPDKIQAKLDYKRRARVRKRKREAYLRKIAQYNKAHSENNESE